MTRVQLRTAIPGPRSQAVVAQEQQHLAPGLQSFALWAGIAIDQARGSHVTDVDGNTFVDLIGGIGVNALGHSHPRYVQAVQEQVGRLSVGSFTSEPRAALVHELAAIAPAGLDRLQLYSGGAEAVESALRLARCATGRQEVVGFWGGFHGKTSGAMALMGSDARHGLGPFPAGTTQIPYADCARCPFGLNYPSCGVACGEFARKAIKQQPQGPVAAVIVEPLQGTAGNLVPPREFLPIVAEAAREAGALLIADEMITGLGRTGTFWGVDHTGVRPDIVTLGKAFGGGYPVSGVLTSTAIARAEPWSRPSGASSSYGGNALAAAAALAAVRIIRDEQLPRNSATIGAHMLTRLRDMQARYPFITHVRGEGLFLGIDVASAAGDPLPGSVMRGVFESAVKRGLLAMLYSSRIRLQPALNITREAADEGLDLLDEVFTDLLHSGVWK
jgi:4-aminobutyrate aminotransferase-like enzyme